MADSLPTMSGANDSTVKDEVAQSIAETLSSPSGGASSASADIAAARETVANKAMGKEEGAAQSGAAAEESSPVGSKDKQAQTAAEADAAATTPGPESSSAGAAVVTDAALQEPQVPAPAVVRNRGDSLSIEHHDDGAAGAAAADNTLVCNITLLLPTGARHPYRIDERYLARRNVDVPGVTESGKKDPFSISVYKLKELILREWREEWEGKPASPSSIRLIHFGKLLDDKEQLNKYHFSAEAPNVVHMSVRPPEMVEDDEAAKGKSGGREGRSREGSSGCCVIL